MVPLRNIFSAAPIRAALIFAKWLLKISLYKMGIAVDASSLPGDFSSFFMASCKDLSGLLRSKKLLLLRQDDATRIIQEI